MSPTRRLARLWDRVTAIDHRQFDRGFAVLVLLFVGVVLVRTPAYSARSQIFPLVIGVPTFLLLVALLAIQLSPRAQALIRAYTVTELFDTDALTERQAAEDAEASAEERRSLPAERTDVLRISVWIAVLLGVVYLVGLMAGSLAFLLVYYRVYARASLPRVLAYSVLVWLFLYVIFELLLGAPLYTGVFEVELPFG